MHSISSRYRKPKGRPTKRGKAIAAAKAKQRFVEPDVSEITSTDSTLESNEKTLNYILMSQSSFSPLLRNVPCDDCGMFTLDVHAGINFGYAVKLELTCKFCKKSFGSTMSSPRKSYCQKFDINSQIVSAFLNTGKGHAAMESFSMTLGLASMDRKTFSKCLDELSDRNDIFKKNLLNASHSAIRKAYTEANPSLKDDILDICVSYDGTWQERGHTSLYGIGIVIDSLTNIVLDYEILSKYCPECVTAARDLDENSAEFFIWKDGHHSVCQQNFVGSSGSMEMNAALTLWKRSISSAKMRYKTVVSDRDSRTFQSLNEAHIYGPNNSIQKEECLNHISKRLGTALRNKVKEWRVKGVTLGGKKKRNLTESTIIKLQNFYRKAIKDNIPDLKLMKSAVLATLFHCMSTDQKPQHQKCPKGVSSWCFYQRAVACNEKPKSHKFMKTQLSEKVVEKILPVYQRLASDELLSRCTSAKTQNANESMHSVIWNKCPKEVFVSKKRLELAVSMAVSEFNFGCLKSLELCKELPFFKLTKTAKRRDNRRFAHNKRKSSEAFKQHRIEKKFKKSKTLDKNYSAGAF